MARILTGVQSTGTPHLGNLLGAVLPAIAMAEQPDNESFLFIADLHSLTQIKDGTLLRKHTFNTAAAWLACGLDTDKTIFYKQSDVSQVTELNWYLNCFFPYQRLTLAHSFKDKADHLSDVNAGLFSYPMLMAADILLYDAEQVPVGKDQQQHLEMTRDVASRFNNVYGQTFVLPEGKVNEGTMLVQGTNGEKMSKSLGNFWTIRDAISKIEPLELRYSLINAPYRQPVEFNDTILQDSSSHYHKLLSAYGEGLSKSGKSDWNDLDFLQTAALNFSNGMDDDFNTRVAIVEIQSVVKYLREKLDSDSDKEISSAVSWLSEFAGDVLGILPDDEEIMVNIEKIEGERMRLQDQVTDLLSQRKIARQNKDWGKADLIRNQLNEIGVIVEDSPKGPVWKLK